MDREFKGNSIIALPDDYVVIDTETTGLDFDYCNLIEISAIRYKNDTLIDQFSTLIRPPLEIVWYSLQGEKKARYVDEFISDLTGITNEMLEDAPLPENVLPQFMDFIGDSLLIGHNVSFDIKFLYDAIEKRLDRHLSNDYIDTLRIAHKAIPGLDHYRLSDIAQACGVTQDAAHRGLADCITTSACYQKMKSDILSKMSEADFFALYRKNKNATTYSVFINSLNADEISFDNSSPIFKKTIVFTGTLERMARKDALRIVANMGGIPADSVTKETNYLVIGNGEFVKSVKDGKTKKMKKAESMALKGQDIHVISENAFFSMIEDI